MKIPALPLLLAAACTALEVHAESPMAIDAGDIDNLLADAERYDGELVKFETCILVTPHGMALFSCEASLEKPMIHFKKPPSEYDDSAFDLLVQKAYQAPRYKELLSLTVTGNFHYSDTELPRFSMDIRDASNFRLIRDPRSAGPGR